MFDLFWFLRIILCLRVLNVSQSQWMNELNWKTVPLQTLEDTCQVRTKVIKHRLLSNLNIKITKVCMVAVLDSPTIQGKYMKFYVMLFCLYRQEQNIIKTNVGPSFLVPPTNPQTTLINHTKIGTVVAQVRQRIRISTRVSVPTRNWKSLQLHPIRILKGKSDCGGVLDG